MGGCALRVVVLLLHPVVQGIKDACTGDYFSEVLVNRHILQYEKSRKKFVELCGH